MAEVTEAGGRPRPLVRTMLANIQSYSVTGTQDEPCSIHRVPPNIRAGDSGSYEPQILSIGPYHHRNTNLRDMEKHKWRYLHNLLRRQPHKKYIQAVKECIEVGGRSDEETYTQLQNLVPREPQSCSIESLLERCIEVVTGSEARARNYYSEPIDPGDDFVKMMVLDGCFIVELLLIFHGESVEDPILNVGWMCNAVRRDILKLENQIPFFILEELFVVVAVERGITDWSLRQHAFYYLMSRGADETPLTEHKIYHLLHFYDVILLPKSPNTRPSSSFTVQSVLKKMCCFTSRSYTLPTWRKPKPTSKLPLGTIPCVVKLEQVGIMLRRKPAETFLDVTFQDGTLYIPFLSIEDETNSVFRNLVALEQCFPDLGSHFTWYVTFLDCIVNTPMDVSILQNRGIVDNTLGSEAVVKLINQLGIGITINLMNPNFAELFTEVNKHCQSRWHEHRARLMRDYFSNPWAIISLLAAVFLLLMTAAQVVLAVLSYNKQ